MEELIGLGVVLGILLWLASLVGARALCMMFTGNIASKRTVSSIPNFLNLSKNVMLFQMNNLAGGIFEMQKKSG